MIIHTNEPLIKRNRKIAQISTLSGLMILVAGLIVSFRMPEQVLISLTALIVGFLISQVGIYYTNRWGRSPKPHELLNQALKGMDNKYHLSHYLSPTSHLLIGPSGIWVLMPRSQNGKIFYRNGRWHQKGGNIFLKVFGAEGLGRPDLEIPYEIERIQKHLSKILPEESLPPIQAAIIFTHPKVVLNLDENEPPVYPTLHINKLKEWIRKTAKSKLLPQNKIEEYQDLLVKKI